MATVIVYSMIMEAPSLMTWERGAAVAFYLNAHVLVRLSKGKWFQNVDVWKSPSIDA